jgi:hypothetical protein
MSIILFASIPKADIKASTSDFLIPSPTDTPTSVGEITLTFTPAVTAASAIP